MESLLFGALCVAAFHFLIKHPKKAAAFPCFLHFTHILTGWQLLQDIQDMILIRLENWNN